MSNFASQEDIIIQNTLEFGKIAEDIIFQFSCKNGEVAGFKITQIGDNLDGTPCIGSQVFDCSSGSPILQGTVSPLPGMDLCGGLFSSGCFPDRDVLAAGCIFYKVDY